jgi:cell division protein FtsL
MIQPQYIDAQPRIRNPRSARTATKTRIVRNSRARYTAIFRVCGVLGVVLVLLLVYVTATSNVTSLTYAVAKAQLQRETLQEDTARLDDRIASLQSEERLATVAAKLGMHEPQQFALVRLGVPRIARNGHFPMWTSIAGWFGSGAPQTRAR